MEPTQDVLALQLAALEKPALLGGFGRSDSPHTLQVNHSGPETADSVLLLAQTSSGSSTNLDVGAKPVGVGEPGRGTSNRLDQVTVDLMGNHFLGTVSPPHGGAGGGGGVKLHPDQAGRSTPAPADPLPAEAPVASAIASARVESALSESAKLVPLRKDVIHLLSVDEGITFNNIVGPYVPPVPHFPVAMTDTMVAVPGAPQAGYVLDITYALGFLANRPVEGVEGWLKISAIGPDGTAREIATVPSTATTYPGDHSARLIFADLGLGYELAPGETLAFQAQAYKIFPDDTVRTDFFTLLPGDLSLSTDLVKYVKDPDNGTYHPNPLFGVPGIAGEIAPIPEPGAATLLIAGLALLVAWRRFR